MKIPFAPFLLAVACLLMGGFARAKIAPPPRMEPVQTNAVVPSTRVYHAFGGETLAVEVLLSGAPGTVLEIQGDLLQKAQSLAVPVQKEIPLGKGIELGDAAMHLHTLALPIPEVKRESLFIARFRIKTTAGGDWQAGGQIVVRAYPPNEAKENLAELAKENRLQLFGSDKRLRAFLESRKIPFTETGTDLETLPHAPRAGAVFLGDASAVQLARWADAHPDWQGNLIVFSPDSNLLPGVFLTPRNGRKIVKVTLPLLDTLSTDPRSQKTLVEILKTAAAQ